MSSISNWKYKKEIINKGTLHNFKIDIFRKAFNLK